MYPTPSSKHKMSFPCPEVTLLSLSYTHMSRITFKTKNTIQFHTANNESLLVITALHTGSCAVFKLALNGGVRTIVA